MSSEKILVVLHLVRGGPLTAIQLEILSFKKDEHFGPLNRRVVQCGNETAEIPFVGLIIYSFFVIPLIPVDSLIPSWYLIDHVIDNSVLIINCLFLSYNASKK